MKPGEVVPCLTIDGKLYVEAGYLTAFCETVKRYDKLLVITKEMAKELRQYKSWTQDADDRESNRILESFEAFEGEK